MALQFSSQPVPQALAEFFERVKALVYSLSPDQTRLVQRGVDLVTGADGQLVRHGQEPATPKSASAVVRGDSASAAVVTVGEITSTHVRLYTTADCTVDLSVTT
jgi:hypothetical protein